MLLAFTSFVKHVDADDLRYKRVKRDWEHGAGV